MKSLIYIKFLLLKEIEVRERLILQMVGSLYPSILNKEIDTLRKMLETYVETQ